MIELDSRLGQIASMVRPGARVADVGTDHGLLIAFLLSQGIAPEGIACDIRPKPLEKARTLLAQLGLESRSRCILCDGLREVSPQWVDDIVIAGMGGEMIAHIIEEAPWLRSAEKHLLLQPMTKVEFLRGFLAENGFETREEIPVASGEFVYSVLSVYYTGQVGAPSSLERWIGKVDQAPYPDTIAYLRRVERTLAERVEGLGRAKEPNPQLEEYEVLLTQLRERMNRLL